eukprot:8897660-Pyramimonas_sp.AAC.1
MLSERRENFSVQFCKSCWGRLRVASSAVSFLCAENTCTSRICRYLLVTTRCAERGGSERSEGPSSVPGENRERAEGGVQRAGACQKATPRLRCRW